MTAHPDSAEEFGDLTSEQVARLDAAALDCGVTTLQLMEIAGWQVARCAWQHMGSRSGEVAVVAGHGNNGGDGLVAARHLATWGCAVHVMVVAEESRVGGLVLDHVLAARKCGIDVTVSADATAVRSGVAGATLVIDALLEHWAAAGATRAPGHCDSGTQRLGGSHPQRRRPQRPRRHERGSVRSVRPRDGDLHPDRDEARSANRRRLCARR